MPLTLKAVPITELKTGPNQIVEKLAQQRLMLTKYGRSVAVMVHSQEWNRITQQLAECKLNQAEVEAIIEASHHCDDDEAGMIILFNEKKVQTKKNKEITK